MRRLAINELDAKDLSAWEGGRDSDSEFGALRRLVNFFYYLKAPLVTAKGEEKAFAQRTTSCPKTLVACEASKDSASSKKRPILNS